MSRQDPRNYVSPRETSPFARFELRRSHLRTSIPGGAMNPGTYVATAPGLDPATERAAALTVCERARGVTDARALMAILGLL